MTFLYPLHTVLYFSQKTEKLSPSLKSLSGRYVSLKCRTLYLLAIPKHNFKISILNFQDYYGVLTRATVRLILKLIKMACVGSCRSVHATKKQIPTISIGFCTHFIGICNGLHLGVGQCERTILGLPTFLGMTCIFFEFFNFFHTYHFSVCINVHNR